TSRRGGGADEPVREASESQGVGTAIRQDLDQLLVEVVAVRTDVARNALLVHLAAAVDVVPKPLIEVAVLASLEHRALVVELDLGTEEAREPARLLPALVARRHVGEGARQPAAGLRRRPRADLGRYERRLRRRRLLGRSRGHRGRGGRRRRR